MHKGAASSFLPLYKEVKYVSYSVTALKEYSGERWTCKYDPANDRSIVESELQESQEHQGIYD